jgi:aspartyl-tRNA(Asn)/glutamyl-tRNA(Gln) amidotransferase subunit C
MINKDEVQHIAKLARLGLGEKEIEKMEKELSLILDYFNLLKEVDVSGIEPSFYSATEPCQRQGEGGDEALASSTEELEKISAREDYIKKSKKTVKKLLDSAPETKEDFVKVKTVL